MRVFGCAGSTNVVVEAIEWAMDPNGDGNFSDKMDVINMSLGANNGFADDPDDVAASIAASAGIIICSAAGNAGDSYYIHSSPAAASGTLGIAATFNDQGGFIADSNVTPNTPGAGAPPAGKYFSIKGSASAPIPGAGLTGNVVYAVPNNADTNGGNPGGPGLSNAAQCAGNIVLVDRGVTTFTDKVTKCLNAGASAVIMNNFTCNPNCNVPIVASTAGQPPGVDVMISRNDRDTIVAASGGFNATTGVPTNPVNVTINNDNAVVNDPTLAVPDTMPTYSSRGPRLPDSATKPDISAPAEVTAVATSEADPVPRGAVIDASSGTRVQNFNGTSSATPHIAGEMSLLKQLHSTWSVQELLAAACNTSTHDLFTTTAHTTQFGVGRVGAGRIDVGLAAATTVVAYNGTDPNLQGVSFGVVDVPVDGSRTLTKNITVTNKGATNITYNTSVANNPALAGATFTVSPANFTVNAGTSTTVTATLTATGSALKHAREASVASTQAGNPRQWLSEAGAYCVLTPTDASPVLRVELYAAPKPASAMHATDTGVVPTAPNTGSFNINLSGASVNTGASLGNGFDIVSLVKAFEGQYASPFAGQPNAPTDRNRIKYAGVTSDALTRGVAAARVVFGVEGFGDAAEPYFGSSDKEIFIDTGDGAGGGPDGIPDFALFLTRAGTGAENVYLPALAKLHPNTAATTGLFTNGLNAAVADTNAYNNSCVTFPVSASQMVDTGYPALGSAGHTVFTYQVVTFDRNGSEVEETPVMVYDLANPGFDVENSASSAQVVFSSTNDHVENFMFKDLSTNFVPVNYNGTNFQNNGSLGVLLFHMHNSTGNRGEMVAFRKPTVSSFSPTSGPVGTNVTITGTNFNAGTGVKFFNNKIAAVTVLTNNTLIAKVPVGAITGPIRVFNAAGSSTAPGNFTVTP